MTKVLNLEREYSQMLSLNFKISKRHLYKKNCKIYMQTTMSTGRDGIHPQLLKTAAPIISSHLSHLFKLSLSTGLIPDEWKKANVTPIHEGGNADDTNNYRPVSVIPIVMKIFERAVHCQLTEYLMTHSMLALEQSGF